MEDLSELERRRYENIQRNADFLASIGLDDVKVSISDAAARAARVAATQRGVDKKRKRNDEQSLPLRRSGRVTIERLKAEIQHDPDPEKQKELDLMLKAKADTSFERVLESYTGSGSSEWKRIDSGPISLSRNASNQPEEVGDGGSWGKPIVELLKSISKEVSTSSARKSAGHAYDIADYAKRLAKLQLREPDVAKLTDNRCTAVWLHPSKEKLLVAAGDKSGCVGLWDVDSAADGGSGSVYRYRPHAGNVAKLFSFPSSPSSLYSVSYDGTVRYVDFGKDDSSFVLGFEAPEDINDLSFTDAAVGNNEHVIFVSRNDGSLSCIDLRASSNTYSWTREVDGLSGKINSVQQHPVADNLLIAAGAGKDGMICVMDIRKASKNWKPVKSFNAHTKSINAAYVSPDGKFCVSVSQDNTIRTWMNFISDGGPKLTSCSTSHDNHTGRWLSTFRPAFDPKHPHSMLIGSMTRPRCIEIWEPTESSLSLKLLKALKSDYLGSVCSRNAFHPSLDVIAASNSSGRVHIFR